MGNDVGVLSFIKIWLSSKFQMKDLRYASYILRIKLLRDRKNKRLALSQASFIEKILARFKIENSKKVTIPSRHGVHLSRDQCPKTLEEIEYIRRVPYASAIESLMYAMVCTRPDICYTIGIVSKYQ